MLAYGSTEAVDEASADAFCVKMSHCHLHKHTDTRAQRSFEFLQTLQSSNQSKQWVCSPIDCQDLSQADAGGTLSSGSQTDD